MPSMELFLFKSGKKMRIKKYLTTNSTQYFYIFSPKDIANLKNEIEKRDGITENGEEVKEGASELPKEEAIAKAPAAVQS